MFPHAKSTGFHSLKRVHFHRYWHCIQNQDPSKFEKKKIIFLTDLQNAKVNHKFLWRSLDWNYILKLYYSPCSSRYHTWLYTIDNHFYDLSRAVFSCSNKPWAEKWSCPQIPTSSLHHDQLVDKFHVSSLDVAIEWRNSMLTCSIPIREVCILTWTLHT